MANTTLLKTKKKSAIELIADERQRQVDQEGWTIAHDDEFEEEQLSLAAASYAMPDRRRKFLSTRNIPHFFPWRFEFWKPSPDNRIKELIKAGALIVAEIERLQRLEQ